MNALTPLLPALQTLTPLGLPAAFRDWYASANAGQAERLARHLAEEFASVASAPAYAVDHAYLRSDGFRANVVQAVRAAEVAESEDKLRFIARALAGCVLAYPPPQLDKFQTMRIIEALSEREIRVFAALFGLLDPVDPYRDTLTPGQLSGGLSRGEGRAALLGLGQLGLLQKNALGEQLTPLARQVAVLTRLAGPPELF